MIPYILKLENFMAFREAELDFRRFRIACISGNNGAGKSTLLDALTWVLFQESRAHDSEELIRIGASEMRVELEFSLEGQTYKVIRTRKRKGKGKTSGKASLDFQLLSAEGYRSLTGKKIQETQLRIESTLKMNYQLFVNSSFILQGKADAFTTSSPAERKQVLAEILQLDAYEKMRLEAQELRRELRGRESLLRSQSLRLEEDLQVRVHLEAHLSDSQQHQALLATKLETLRSELAHLNRVEENNLQLSLHIQHAMARQSEDSERLSQIHGQLETLSLKLGNMQKWLEHAPQIEDSHERLLTTESRLQLQSAAYEQFLQLETHHLELTQKLERKRHQLELEEQQAYHRFQNCQQQLNSLDAFLAEAPQIEIAFISWEEAIHSEANLLNCKSQSEDLEQQLFRLQQQQISAKKSYEFQLDAINVQISELQELLAQAPELETQKRDLQAQLEDCLKQQLRLDAVQTRGLELRHEQENLSKTEQQLSERLKERKQKQLRLQAHKDTVCPMCERLLTEDDIDLLLSKYSLEMIELSKEISSLQPMQQQLTQEILKMRTEYQELARAVKRKENLQNRFGNISANLEEIAKASQKLPERIHAAQQTTLQWKKAEQDFSSQSQNLQKQISYLNFSPKALNLIQSQIRELQGISARKIELDKARITAPEMNKILQQSQQEAEARSQTLKEFTQEMQTQLQKSQVELEKLSEVPILRRQLQQEIESLAQARERFNKLQEARIRSENVAGQEKELQIAQLELENQLNERAIEISRLQQEQNALKPLLMHRKTLLEDQENILLAEKQMHAEIFSLEKELEALLNRFKELESQNNQLHNLLYEIQLYDVLEESFGKNGLQAVLIENALPEIEQIANEMLASMSEGRMHIKLQTLRSYKTRDKLAETLDILISDELGTRNYETFSAGEAFRVNFALRLSISKLLARRAGARLQTLVIDEGFGSQDAQGKMRLIEAINAVAPDFATILVITHVDELKALFPCRVEVSKEADGSHLRIMHV